MWWAENAICAYPLLRGKRIKERDLWFYLAVESIFLETKGHAYQRFAIGGTVNETGEAKTDAVQPAPSDKG